MQNMKAPDNLFAMLLARLGMKPNELPSEQRIQVDDLLAAVHDPQWSVRVAAVQALGQMAGQVPIITLLEALHDKHEAVRAAAARTLGKLGGQIPIEPSIYALGDPLEALVYALEDHSWMVRADSAYALGQLGPRTRIQPLVKAMEDEDATVRAAVVRALGQMEERTPIETLVSALDDPEWFVREAAVLALGERIPIAALIKAAIHDKDETVRETAMKILQQTEPDRASETRSGTPSPSSSHSANRDAGQIPYIPTQILPLRARRRLLPYLIKIGLAALVVTGLILASLAIWYMTHR